VCCSANYPYFGFLALKILQGLAKMDFKFFSNSPFKQFTQGKSFKPLKDSGSLPAPGGKYTLTGNKYHTSTSEGKYNTAGCKFITRRLEHNNIGLHKSRTLPNMGKKEYNCGGSIGVFQTVPLGLKVTLGESGLRQRLASKGNLGKIEPVITDHILYALITGRFALCACKFSYL
jgi:hypothetical protein